MTTLTEVTPARTLTRVLGAGVLAVVVALLMITVVIPLAAGGKAYTVLTSSMEPALPPGSLVLVRPVKAGDIGVGSVITYQLASRQPEVVTHRVVTMGVRENGSPVFRTQGDANPSPDPKWVRPVQVRGAVWYAVPYVGRLNSLLTPNVRDIVIRVVALALVVYGLVELCSAARDRITRRSRRRRGLDPGVTP
jgi:signal peptidase